MDEVKENKGWSNEDQRLTLIGHSYGTTTEAEALKKSGAGNFVALASAGLYRDTNPLDYKQDLLPWPMNLMPENLQVPSNSIHAGTSPNDLIAHTGGLLTPFSRRADPDWPTGFGVDQFAAGDAHVPQGYEGILGGDGQLHAPAGHDLLKHDSDSAEWGYADQGSTTNWNAAAIFAGPPELEVK